MLFSFNSFVLCTVVQIVQAQRILTKTLQSDYTVANLTSAQFFFNTKHLFDYALHFLAVISHFNYTIILTNFLVVSPQGKFVHECESVDLSRKSSWACGCPSDGLAKNGTVTGVLLAGYTAFSATTL